MAVDVDEAFLERYRDELTYLRRMGAKFAKQYPRIARRLEINGGPSPDPHVERLLEGVAFLTARLQNTLEGELPEITQGLLGFLYPHFTQLVPSLAVAQFQPDDGGAGMTSGLDIPAETQLYVETSFQGRTCRFRTASGVTLWPIEVVEAKVLAPATFGFLSHADYAEVRSTVRVRLKTNSEPFDVLGLDQLRFYLDGEAQVTGPLYELLSGDLIGVACLADGAIPGLGQHPPLARMSPAGFEPDDAVLPSAPQALPGCSLLQEYFAFPEKFLFVDVTGIEDGGAQETLDLVFLLGASPRRKLSLSPDTFALGCTPIANLFYKISEPIHVDGTRHVYKINPDARWERTTELHSIIQVTSSLRSDDPEGRLEPLYGVGHSSDEGVTYWDARRVPAQGGDMPGTDVNISFVDAHLQPSLPERDTLRAHMLCTNRDLPTHIDQGERLHIVDGPHALVRALTRPTQQLTPPLQGASLWRLVSHLSMSHLGLPQTGSATEALREQLRVYAFTSGESIEPQLAAIQSVEVRPVALRADDGAWRGFCRVQRITVTIDEDRFAGISPILFGHVLSKYFGMHASVNAFAQLALASRQRGLIKLWPPSIPKADCEAS